MAEKVKQSDRHLFGGPPGKQVWYYLGFYLLVSIVLFAKALFDPGKLVFGTDLLSGNVFFRVFFSDYLKTHLSWPVWDPYIHGGMPFVDGMHGDIFYPPTLIFYILFGVLYAWGFTIALHVFFAGVFMYLFLRELGIRGKVAFLFGLIYMLAPVFVSLVYAGHNGKMFVITLTPLIFFLFHKAIGSGKLLYYVLISFTIFLVMTSPHMQLAFFLFATLGAYFVVTVIRLWREKRAFPVKPFALFIAAVVIGLVLSLVQFLTPYSYLKNYSMRTLRAEEGQGFEYSTSWSMHWEEVGSLLLPEFAGDDVQGQEQTYWGRNPFKLNSEHFSLIAMFLAVLGMGLWRRPGRWFFFWTAIITLVFAIGADTPFFRIFYMIPGISSFRAPSLIAFLTAFSVVTLGAMGLEGFFQAKTDDARLKSTWKIYTYINIGYSVLALLIIVLQMGFFELWFRVFGYTPDPTKLATLSRSLSSITLGAVISLVLVWGLHLILKFNRDGKLSSSLVVGILAAVSFLYMWHFDSRFIITIDPKPYYEKTPLIDFLKQRETEGPFRVLTMPKTLRDYYLAYHGIEELSLTMIHGNQLATFERLAGRRDNYYGLLYQPVQDLLNTRYILSSQPLPPQVFAPERFVKIKAFGNLGVYENRTALPRAFPLYSYEVMTADQILRALSDTAFDYRSCLLLEKEYENMAPGCEDSASSEVVPARVHDIENGSFEIDVEMQKDGFLFVSENYYPAWKAFEQGTRLPVLKADLTFRAVPLPKGAHTVTFRYDNETFNAAFVVSRITFAGLLVLLIGLVVSEGPWRREKTKKPVKAS